jgi:hypothetical protein
MRTPSARVNRNWTPDGKIRSPLGLTLDRVWALLPILVPTLVAILSRMVAVDLAYHVRAGGSMLSDGHIPRADSYTFTVSGHPWFDQQWGAQVLLALLHRAGGWATVSFVRGGLTGAIVAFVFLACRARGAPPRSSSVLALTGFFVALPAMAMRPQLFAMVLFAASLWALSSREGHPGRVWLLPVFALAWANLHGSFVLAPLLVGLATIEELLARRPAEARRLLLVFGATVLATFVTPFGPLAWRYVYQLAADPLVRNNVTEWAPVTVRTFAGAAFLASGLAVATYLARRPERATWSDLLWLTTFFVLALPAIRGIVWWSLAAPVVVSRTMFTPGTSSAPEQDRRGSPLLNTAVVGVLVVAIVIALPWWRAGTPAAMLSEAPIGLSDVAGRTLAPGTRLFVSEPWASWFEYAQPSIRVFTDPRIEIFPTNVWTDYSQVRLAGTGWQQILARWKVGAVIVERKDPPALLAAISTDPAWEEAFEDREGVLFIPSASAATPAGAPTDAG